jgi:hypothetical protein
MLDPTGIMAVVNSFIAFFNAVQSAIEYLRDILEIVNRWVTTLAAVAAGNIVPGAQMLEQGLAAAVPVAIGFLANQVGLGNVPEKIVEIIGGLRQLVDQAIDWLIDTALRLGQAALNALGLGRQQQPEQDQPPAAAPEGPITADSIPPGLPPEEVKQRILEMVRNHLQGGGKSSITTVHSTIDAIMSANRDRGLVSLRVSVPNAETMDVLVEAAASSPEGARIAWSEIFSPSALNENDELEEWRRSLSRASQASYAAVAVDGQPIGSLSSSEEGLHAEEGLVRGGSWTQAITTAQAHVATSGSSQVTLMINRSPCVSCVNWLNDAIRGARGQLASNAARVRFVLAATGTYRRQARLSPNDLATLKTGATQIAQRTGRPFDDVFKEQEQIWKDDLRSMSTEWSDSDAVYSGLSDLTSAGWSVMGLDAGQTVTPRQVEMRRIAAELAEKMVHSA